MTYFFWSFPCNDGAFYRGVRVQAFAKILTIPGMVRLEMS